MSPDLVSARAELLRIVRGARRRWRARLALQGMAVVLAAGAGAALIGGWVVARPGVGPVALDIGRVLIALVVAAVAARWLVLPQLRRAADTRIALYLEEHEPSLDAALISALDAVPADAASPELLRRLAADAVARAHAVEDGRRVERQRLRRAATLLAATPVAVAVLLAAGPAHLGQGVLALLEPWRRAEAATPFDIEVRPGDATVPRGADLTITARLRGFASGRVDLLVRRAGQSAFERIPMSAPGDTAGFQGILFDVAAAADYAVDAGGVRSRVFHVRVADLPYARRLEAEYRFPAYTALPPRRVEDAGDLSALRGTLVRLRVWTTRPAGAGRIVLGDGRAFPLTAGPDGSLSGTLPVDRAGFYHLELRGPDGRPVTGSPQYAIDALEDRPPTVTVEKPGRDQSATSVEEVFVQARASDDYGVARLELVYAVNGGAEQHVPLYQPARAPLRDVSAGHTLYLEELGLKPGDLVAYYARATDSRPAADAAGHASSDIYFLQVRPFRKEYRSADERGGGGGGGDPADGQLSEREKQIIAATFNLLRDRPELSAKDADEHRTTIALAQQRLREQLRTLADRMQARGLAGMDSTLAAIVALLPKAMADMSAAEDRLHAGRESDALPPEQRALQQLQRAEAMYRDVRISMDDSQGGGGQSPQASDLADLFELEQDKLRNQYETVRRSQEDQARSQLDATADRLRELAQRQQQAAERQRAQAGARAGGSSAGGSSGGQAQRELAQQAEEEARRLERLARENPQRPELEESARQLRAAADAMRQAAADPSGAGAQAARDRLEAARRLLDRQRTDQLGQGATDAARRAQELAQAQQRIAADAARAANGANGASGARDLQQREEQLGAGVQDLESRLDRLAAAAAPTDRETARKLAAAAGTIRDQQLKEKIRGARDLLGQRPDATAYGERLQSSISAGLDSLRARTAEAARAATEVAGGAAGKDQQAQRNLERAAELARGLESLGERMRESADAARGPGASERGRPSSSAQASGQARGAQASPPSGRPGSAQAQNGARGAQGAAGDQPGGAASGQRGQASRPGGPVPAPGGDGGGDAAPPPGAGSRPGAIAPEDRRQFQAEARQRLADAEALRRDLAAQGVDPRALDDVIARLRALGGDRVYADPAGLQQLQDAALDGLRRLELALRREIAQDGRDAAQLSGSSAVPEAYRRLVEQYFKSLSQTPSGKPNDR